METSTSTTDRTVELLWGLRVPSNRGPTAAFTTTDIANAAITIADRTGFESVSMEDVARALGYTKMSLYRHVASKAELQALMVDLAIGDPPDVASIKAGWRDQIRHWSEALWQVWDDHPWIPAVTLGPRPLGPNEVGWSVALLDILDGLHLQPDDSSSVVTVISGYLHSAHNTGSSGSQPWNSDLQVPNDLLDAMSRAGTSYASLMRLMTVDPKRTSQKMSGLELILDGIEVHLSRGSGTGATSGKS